jgi:hypothetical protein
VAAFIHHAAFGGDFLKECVSFMQPLAEESWIAHEDIDGKAGGDFFVDFLGGMHPVTPGLGHDDEEVDIGIRRGFSVGVGTEEDDAVGIEGGGDVGAVTLDVLHGNHEWIQREGWGLGNWILDNLEPRGARKRMGG